MREVHPIETSSLEILRGLVDLSALAPLHRAVVERVVHASADLGYVGDLVCDESSLAAGAAALAAGAPLVADVAMVAAGVTSRRADCRLGDPRTPRLARELGLTRSAAGVRVALDEHGPGAVWVVGCAPTALFELLRLADEARPALVVGLPVGFVGAAQSKAELRASGLPAVSNVSAKGGSAVAAAAVNALLYSESPPGSHAPGHPPKENP